jgi:NMD protein affecting ribosome stability and mRNA decay
MRVWVRAAFQLLNSNSNYYVRFAGNTYNPPIEKVLSTSCPYEGDKSFVSKVREMYSGVNLQFVSTQKASKIKFLLAFY